MYEWKRSFQKGASKLCECNTRKESKTDRSFVCGKFLFIFKRDTENNAVKRRSKRKMDRGRTYLFLANRKGRDIQFYFIS